MSPLLLCTLDATRIAWLPQFVEHYRGLGVDRFLLTLHTSPALDPVETRRQRASFARCVEDLDAGVPRFVACHFNAMNILSHKLHLVAEHARPGDWLVWTDSDEWQMHPRPIPAMIDWACSLGCDYVPGVLVDRVATDRSLAPFDPARTAAATYPRTCMVSLNLLKTDIRKVTLARHDLRPTPGHHRPADRAAWRPFPRQVQVHHYKWDSTVRERLLARLRPEFKVVSPWWTESLRILDYLDARDGFFDEADLAGWDLPARQLLDMVFHESPADELAGR